MAVMWRRHNAFAWRLALIPCAMCVCLPDALADSIVSGRQVYENVLVVETPDRYYVRVPDTGELITFTRESVKSEDVCVDADHDRRDTLRRTWIENAARRAAGGLGEAAREPRERAVSLGRVSEESEQSDREARETERGRDGDAGAGAGTRSSIPVGGVTLADALDAVLRPLNLGYVVVGDTVWISTPERLRTEAFEAPETRAYELDGLAAADILPKIIVTNRGGVGRASSQAMVSGAGTRR